MRRLFQHTVLGVSLTAATGAAVLTGLGAPVSDSVLAVPAPAPITTVSVSASPSPAPARPTPAPAAAEGTTAAAADADGDTQATAAEQATRRSAALAAQSRSIGQQRTRIEAERRAQAAEKKRRADAEAAEARAAVRERKAKAEREAAEAKRTADEAKRTADEAKRKAAAAVEAAAEKAAARRAAAKRAAAERGYQPGTTDPREMARQILSNRFDYGSEQFRCFNDVIIRESNWDVNATNPSSGAYGIPQALPGSKMASAGSDWRTNPATQIIWAVGYMKDRYGSPCEAWSFKSANGWY